MFTLLFRKMRNTKWMVLCLLIGFVMASAMMSTIPIYMNASLQRMLVKDLESFQTEYEIYPGSYNTSYGLKMDISGSEQQKAVENYNNKVEAKFKELGLPEKLDKKYISDEYLYVRSLAVSEGNPQARFTLGGMTDISDHISIKQGRMFTAGKRSDGVYECVATEKALKSTELAIDTVYEIADVFDDNKSIKIEIVGVFDVKDENDAYWAEGLDSQYTAVVFTDYDTMLGDCVDTGVVNITKAVHNYAVDYASMNMTDLASTNEMIAKQKTYFGENSIGFSMPASDILKDYESRSSQLQLVLWLLQIPVILMIIFYLFMVSQLNVEQERNEIAVFKSRGASRLQIMGIYALESLVLGVLTVIIGPFAGLGLCKVLGASNGFLEFVNRRSLPVHMTIEAVAYAAIAVAVFFVTTMIPIFPATKTTIVEHKQSKAKKKKHALWEKVCLDFILVGGSVGWLYYYNKTQEKLVAEGVTDTTATVNPIMFVASTAFILGLGLFLIRIYPYIIRLLARIGRRVWSPAQYVSLTNIGRSSTGRERFLMLFLVLTVSLGVFFANTARALNRNAEESVAYEVGCDAVLTEQWYSSKIESAQQTTPQSASQAGSQQTADESDEEDTETTIQYVEPVFERFEKLAGVEDVTKVFRKDGVTISSNKMNVPRQQTKSDDEEKTRDDFLDQSVDTSSGKSSTSNVQLMTIVPSDFSKVCKFEDRLLPVQLNNYLNALAEYTPGVILSSSFKSYGLELGDTVECKWGGNESFEVTILAFVDYWPGLSPYKEAKNGGYMDFAVMNYDYVNVQTSMEPYEVWFKLKDGASVQEFYDSIDEAGIKPLTLESASQQTIEKKNDPMLQGMNGALTLGFIIIMVMCIIGFLIYWILSIKSRTLQFGILRAMGMKFREIIMMIVYEQLLVSGVAIFAAIFIGGITSDLFVPLFQSIFDASQSVPPFAVIPERSDYLKLYAVIGVMLLTAFVVLGRLIKKIKISQALKLGED